MFSRCILLLLVAAGFRAQAADPLHCFWEVTGPSNTVHFLGSIHFMKPDAYPLAPIIENTFERAKVVAFETDIEALNSPRTAAKMMQAGAAPAGKKLADLIDAKLYQRLERAIDGGGLPIEVFDGMRPWMVGVMLATMDIQKLGYMPEHGVDHRFHKMAKAQGKRIVALETVDSQLGVFTSLDAPTEAGLLSQSLEEMKRIPVVLEEMVLAWKTGDAEKLDKLMNEGMKGSPGLYQKLLVDRNHKWIPSIEKLLRGSDPGIVIVGAGHLVGINGVPELVRRRGYQVRQR